jgi:hypothetical protein
MQNTRKFFYQNGINGLARCLEFTATNALKGVMWTSHRFPTLGNNLVLTKPRVVHPHKSGKSVGMLLFKRMVQHKCTGQTSACTSGRTVADVHKVGYCVKCDSDIFASTMGELATETELKNFVDTCVPKAFNADGSIKASFKCTGTDLTYAQATMAGF